MNYSHKIKTPASAPAITVEEMRAHLQYFEQSSEVDALLAFFIAAGEERIENITGRPLGETVYQQKIDCFPGEIKLLRGPVKSVASVKYKSPATGTVVTLSQDTDIEVDIDSLPARISPRYGKVWPQVFDGYLPIEIEYTAGGESNPPKLLKLALRFLVSAWFSNREALTNVPAKELPDPIGFRGMLGDLVLETFS